MTERRGASGLTGYKILFSAVAVGAIGGSLMYSSEGASADFWKLVAFCAAVALAASIVEIRRDFDAFLRGAAILALAVGIFAGVAWWHAGYPEAVKIAAGGVGGALALGAWARARGRTRPQR